MTWGVAAASAVSGLVAFFIGALIADDSDYPNKPRHLHRRVFMIVYTIWIIICMTFYYLVLLTGRMK